MRLATVEHEGALRAGVVRDDPAGEPAVHLLPPGTTVIGLLAEGRAAQDRADRAAAAAPAVPLGQVRLQPPLAPPTVRDFVAFEEHVEGVRKSVDGVGGVPEAWYDAPTFYFTNPYAVIGAHDDVPVPPGSRVLDFELEVAAVIGREGRDLSPEQARDHIAGYTIFNDWSARDLQSREMQVGLGPAKGKDTATTLGPWIVTADELEPHRDAEGFLALALRAEVNGARRRRGPAVEHGLALRGPRRLRLPRHRGATGRRAGFGDLRQRRLPRRAVGPRRLPRRAPAAGRRRRRHPDRRGHRHRRQPRRGRRRPGPDPPRPASSPDPTRHRRPVRPEEPVSKPLVDPHSGRAPVEAHLHEVADGVFAYVQPDGSWMINNTGFLVARDGVSAIDACSTERRTRAFLDTIAGVTAAPVRTLVNTHHHPDHTAGNGLFSGAAIVAHEQARPEMRALGLPHNSGIWTDVDYGDLELALPFLTFADRMTLWADDLRCELLYAGGPAHTTNDVVVWIPERSVLFAGDLLFHGGTPFLLSGSVLGAIDVLEGFVKPLGARDDRPRPRTGRWAADDRRRPGLPVLRPRPRPRRARRRRHAPRARPRHRPRRLRRVDRHRAHRREPAPRLRRPDHADGRARRARSTSPAR